MASPKYNRTYHFPWSEGATNDDKISTDISHLIGQPIVITEKMDGSNTSLEIEGCFARTHSGPPSHASFDGLKALHATIKHLLHPSLQLFGEWCYAVHSIKYEELPGYFFLFNVRDVEKLIWYSWDEVLLWAEEISVNTVPVLFEGQVSSEKELETLIKDLMSQPSCCGGPREGIVARVRKEFSDKDFHICVAKCVRANHVNPNNDHWKHQTIFKNKLK